MHQTRVPARARHALTVGVEDFFQAGAFSRVVERRHWHRFERRLERSTHATLDLLDATSARATFFVTGWVAEVAPELVREISARGHEVASRGYARAGPGPASLAEWRDDLTRAREAIEAASGTRVIGHRAARLWYRPRQLDALTRLAELGYAYDSSLAPVLRRFAADPAWAAVREVATPSGSIVEVPVSTTSVLGMRIPIAGGNYFRQLPEPFLRREVHHRLARGTHPFVMYFHTWELDPDQPRLAAPLAQRVRHYRHLERMQRLLGEFLEAHTFGSVAEVLALAAAAEATASEPAAAERAARRRSGERRRAVADAGAVTIVVPCQDSGSALAGLGSWMDAVAAELPGCAWVLVDDGSGDGTWEALCRLAERQQEVVLIRHPRRLGTTAAIRSGLLRARTGVVCTTPPGMARPSTLAALVQTVTSGRDIVVADASVPPQGQLAGWLVPWADPAAARSPVRAYRRRAALGLRVDRMDDMGLVEQLARTVVAGGRVGRVSPADEVTAIESPGAAAAAALGAELLGEWVRLRVKRATGRRIRSERRALAVGQAG